MKKLVNGELIDMTDAEIAEVTSEHDVSPFDNLIRELRQTRNSKLQVTDWMTCSDSQTMTDEWKAYRQALRDIPQTYKEYSKVEWPTQPSKIGPNTK